MEQSLEMLWGTVSGDDTAAVTMRGGSHAHFVLVFIVVFITHVHTTNNHAMPTHIAPLAPDTRPRAPGTSGPLRTGATGRLGVAISETTIRRNPR
jgi:hypothetical protein